jgi:hypothetical protein
MLDNIYLSSNKCDINILLISKCNNVTLCWQHWSCLNKFSNKLLPFICYARNGLFMASGISDFAFDAILLWVIHFPQIKSTLYVFILFIDFLTTLSLFGTVPTSLLSVVLNTPCLAEKQQLQFYGHSHISYQR